MRSSRRRTGPGRAAARRAERSAEARLRWAVGDWLAVRRLSRRELARRAGLSRRTVERLASGRALRVELQTLARVCRALELAPPDLIVWEGQDPVPPGVRARARQLRLPGRAWG